MSRQISFIAYPASDLPVSRRFYDLVLGVEPRIASGDWIEYDLGETTFVISQSDAQHPTPVRGALVAFEVADLEREVARLQPCAVSFRGGIAETPVCRFIVALDPDGSEFLIHQRKANPSSA